MLSLKTRDYLGKQITGLVARLLPCGEISLHEITAVSADLHSRERSLQQFLEIATSQIMFHEYVNFSAHFLNFCNLSVHAYIIPFSRTFMISDKVD